MVKHRSGLALLPSRNKCRDPSGVSGAQSGSDGTRTRDLRRDRSDLEGGEAGQIPLFDAE
jgi:hypothetical protein